MVTLVSLTDLAAASSKDFFKKGANRTRNGGGTGYLGNSNLGSAIGEPWVKKRHCIFNVEHSSEYWDLLSHTTID